MLTNATPSAVKSVLGGLALLIAAFGAAEAKSCRLDGAKFVSEGRLEAGAISGAGKRYALVRVASRFETLGPDTFRPGAVTGSIAFEVRSEGRSYVISQDYVPGSSPWATAVSWPKGDAMSKIEWNGRSRRQETRLWKNDGRIDIYSGPLAGLNLVQTNCRR